MCDGNVHDLITKSPNNLRHDHKFLCNLFLQMLRALAYTASKGLVHRDLKPENSLYVRTSPSAYPQEDFRFVLADFGCSKDQDLARTTERGTPLFMAPEMSIPNQRQTHKSDVYSLAVSFLYICEAGQITSRPKKHEIRSRVLEAMLDAQVTHLQPLLKEDPSERPSAQEILLQYNPGDEEAHRMVPQPLRRRSASWGMDMIIDG